MNPFEYTPDDLSIHQEGAIRLMIMPIQSHENGLAEWPKNSADAYVRTDVSPDRRVIVLVFDYADRSRPPSIGCLDFVGMSSYQIEEFFRKWADPDAATRSAKDDVSLGELGGHGNGGKCYMTQMFNNHAYIKTVRNELSCT